MPAIPLHLTDALASLAISAEALLARLQGSRPSVESLCEEFHCTPEDVAATLEDSTTNRLLHIKTKFALLQAQVTAVQYMPQAMAQLKILAETSEKPEVAAPRSTTLINIAGLPTTTEKRPAPPPPPDPGDAAYIMPVPSRTDEQYRQRLGYVARMTLLQKGHGIDINRIPDDLENLFAQSMENFFNAHKIPIIFDFMDPPPASDTNNDEDPNPSSA